MSHGRRLLAQNMNAFDPDNRTSKRNSHGAVRWTWLAAAGALIVLLAVLLPRAGKSPKGDADSTGKPAVSTGNEPRTNQGTSSRPARRSREVQPGLTAEMVVSNKVSQFARNRREVLRNYAKHLKIQVPAEFESFMDAAESGRWEEVQSQFEALNKNRTGAGWSQETANLWPDRKSTRLNSSH